MRQSDIFTELQFVFDPYRRKEFASKKLLKHWIIRYPELFDEDDLRMCLSQCKKYHFFECLAAVLLFESTGYLSLLEKYETRRHKRKIQLFQKLVPPKIFDLIFNRGGAPDLFVYAPDHSDWYFCEVKGGSDRLRPAQLKRAQEIFEISGRKVRLLSFQRQML